MVLQVVSLFVATSRQMSLTALRVTKRRNPSSDCSYDAVNSKNPL